MITATYTTSSVFYLPQWMKPEEIRDRWVKYDTLYVLMMNDLMYEIKPHISATDSDSDFKYPEDTVSDTEEMEEEDWEDIEQSLPDEGDFTNND